MVSTGSLKRRLHRSWQDAELVNRSIAARGIDTLKATLNFEEQRLSDLERDIDSKVKSYGI